MRRYLIAAALPLGVVLGMLGFAAQAQDDEVQVVQVVLKNGDIGFTDLKLDSAKARFEIENAGTNDHAFEIEADIDGKTVEVSTPVLAPGGTSILVIELPAGTYDVYCPVGDHRERGMASTITFPAEG